PPRSTIAVPSLPVCRRVVWKPSPIASIATSTPTTPAMPITITEEEPSRCASVLRPTRVTESVRRPDRVNASHAPSTTASNRIAGQGNAVHTISHATTIANMPSPNRNFFIVGSSTSRQCIHDLQAHPAQCGQHADHDADHDHHDQRLQPDARAHR